MGVKIDTAGAQRKLRSLERKIQRAVERKALREAGKKLKGEMQEQAPVETGRLRRSIKVKAGRRSRRGQTINVIATVPYAHKIEELYGFASIAADIADADIRRTFADTINAVIDEL